MTDFRGGDSPPAPRASSRSKSASDRPPSVSAPTDRKLRRDETPHGGGLPGAQTVSTFFSHSRVTGTPVKNQQVGPVVTRRPGRVRAVVADRPRSRYFVGRPPA